MQALDDQNLEGRHIIRVSGHKNVESVQNHARALSASRKRKISDISSERCNPNQVTSTSTTKTEENKTTVAPPPEIDFQRTEIISSSNNILSTNNTNTCNNDIISVGSLYQPNNEEATDAELAHIPETMLRGRNPFLYKCSNINVHYHFHSS